MSFPLEEVQKIEKSEPNELFREDKRLKTFANWDVDFVDKHELAMLGFYFEETQNEVRCAFCRGSIENWELWNKVLITHFTINANCPLLTFSAYDNVPIDPERLDQVLRSASYDTCDGCENTVLRIDRYDRKWEVHTPTTPNYSMKLDTLWPLHPQYNTFSSRLRTYKYCVWKGWKSEKDPFELIDAGFFYTKFKDIVICFCCGVAVCDWRVEDCPWEVHVYANDSCEYVKLVKGETLVDFFKIPFIGDSLPGILLPSVNYKGTHTKDDEHGSLFREDERLETFANWDVDFIDKHELAMLGFHLKEGTQDEVRCAFCREVIVNWRSWDKVFITHFVFDTFCPLLTLRAYMNVPIDQEKFQQVLLSASYADCESCNNTVLRIDRYDRKWEVHTTMNKGMDDEFRKFDISMSVHREFQHSDQLLMTYLDCDWNSKKMPYELVGAGFFYTKINDEVTCFCCGVTVSGWRVEDCPWEVHAYANNSCEYVKFGKRQALIDHVKAKFSEDLENSEALPTISSTPSIMKVIVNQSEDGTISGPSRDVEELNLALTSNTMRPITPSD